MNLKSQDLYWPDTVAPRKGFGPLRADAKCDVAIIGAGLSGVLIAHALSGAGLDVMLLEKRDPGQGSTSASTALVLYEIDTPLVELSRQRNRADAVKCYRRCLEAIPELEEIIRQLGGRCGFRRRSSLYLASRPRDLADLEKEFAARKRAGFAVEFLTPAEIATSFSFSAPGAIYSTEAAEVNPLQLTFQLLNESVRRGVRVFSRTEVCKVTESHRGTIAHTAAGHRINSKWVVVAAGFESGAPAAQRVVKLKSSYALVTCPVSAFPGWHQRCLIWETRRPYFYLRTTADNRILIGGEDEDFVDARKRDRLIRKKSGVLSQKLRSMFPEIPIEPAACWAGTFGETKDGLPYIGSAKPRSRILYALCYGANGTNFAVIAADIIRDLVRQRRNPHARLFAFGR